MYDFVAVITFDDETVIKILSFKEMLEHHNFKTSNKLPPHITIDLYDNLDSSTIIELANSFAGDLRSFPFEFIKLGNFDNKVLFLQPNNIEQFEQIKRKFDSSLGQFKIKTNANKGIYRPHMTLITTDDIKPFQQILDSSFKPFNCEATHICIYAKDKQLIKKYELKK